MIKFTLFEDLSPRPNDPAPLKGVNFCVLSHENWDRPRGLLGVIYTTNMDYNYVCVCFLFVNFIFHIKNKN